MVWPSSLLNLTISWFASNFTGLQMHQEMHDQHEHLLQICREVKNLTKSSPSTDMVRMVFRVCCCVQQQRIVAVWHLFIVVRQ